MGYLHRSCYGILFTALCIVLCLASAPSVHAQRYGVGPTTVEGSTITTQVYGFQVNDTPLDLDAFIISATVNGQSARTSLASSGVSTERTASIYVMVDASSYTSTPAVRDLFRAGARAASSLARDGADLLALAQFDERPTTLLGFVSDRAAYQQGLNDLHNGNGMALDAALLDPTMGGLSMLQGAPRHRALLLLTSSSAPISVDNAIALAKAFNISVYVVGIQTTLHPTLRQLCEATGGVWSEMNTTEPAVVGQVLASVAHAKNLRSQQLIFTSPDPCSPLNRVSISAFGVTRSFDTEIDPLSTSRLVWLPASLDFGTGAQEQELMATVFVQGPEPISFEASTLVSGSFTLMNDVIGLETLAPGDRRTFRIRRAAGSDGTYAELTIAATTSSGAPICEGTTYSMRGGAMNSGDRFRLVSPNGGEQVLAGGQPVSITWTNTLPQSVVRIDLSTDDGQTWRPITEQAQGLRYEWTPGPEVTSTARLRIEETTLPDSAIVSLVGHRSPVYSTVFANDDRWVITGGHDGTIRIWNSNTGAFIRQLGSHNGWVWDLAVSPDGRYLASAGHDGSVNIWEIATGQRLRSIIADGRVWSVSYAPDGQRIAVGTDRSLTIYQPSNGQKLQSVSTGAVRCLSVMYTADGSAVLSAEGPTVSLREASNIATVRQSFSGHSADVYAVAITPSMDVVYSGGADFTIRRWSVQTGAQTHQTSPSIASILDLSLSPTNPVIASAGADGTVKTWTLQSLDLTNSFAKHIGAVYTASFDGNGMRIASGATDNRGIVWNVTRAATAQDVSDAPFSIVGGSIATGDANHGSVRIGEGSDISTQLLANTGSNDLVVRSIRIVRGDVSEFTMMAPTMPLVLKPGESLRVRSSFQPRSVGARTATVEIETGVGSGLSTLRGEGLSSDVVTTNLRPSPTTFLVDFGRQLVGQTQTDTVIRMIIPAGQPALSITQVALVGVQKEAFSVISGGAPFTLQPGNTYSLGIRFSPTTVGRFASRIELTRADGSIISIRLYGEGLGDGRIATSTATMLYQTNPCERNTTIQKATILNQGTAPLTIYSVAVIGTRSDDFSITSPSAASLPVTIDAGGSLDISVAYAPRTTGSNIARLVVSSSGIGPSGSTVEIPIVARQDSLGFELTVPRVHFENVNARQSASQTVTILNTGSVSLQWPQQAIDLGAFRIENIEPTITPAGGTSSFTIRFKGAEPSDVPYQAEYIFKDSICGRDRMISMSATVKSFIGATVAADVVRSTIGSEVSVPVRLLNRTNFDRTSITSINARIRVNGTILTPVDTPSTFADGNRTFTVSMPVPASGDLLTTLRFRTTWGDDTSAVVRLDSIWASDTVVFTAQHGEVILDDLCRAGGPRLFLRRSAQSAPTTGINAQTIPHPVSDQATVVLTVIEEGPTTVQLVDVNGRVVTTLVDRDLSPGRYLLPLDGQHLDVGAYTLTLRTRTQFLSHRVSVVR